MIKRRHFLHGLGAGAALPRPASAQTLQSPYPELILATAETSGSVMEATDRFAPFAAYLGKQLGRQVTLRIFDDYNAIIEGQRAGKIHIGHYGPASFARALIGGIKTTAFIIDVDGNGNRGYYSVLYVRHDSPYQHIEDLTGKTLGLIKPSSASGYIIPLYNLHKLGIDAERFFSKIREVGNHENAILSLLHNTVDTCANWWNAPGDSNLSRMVAKGLAKSADGKPATEQDFRIILKSDLIMNSPIAYLDSLPPDLKSDIKFAYLSVATKEKAMFARLVNGTKTTWALTDNAAYDDTLDLIRFIDQSPKLSR